MPNSLKCRLKGLVHKGLLSERDLNRIIIIPDNATNGDMIKALFPNAEYWDSTEFENEERINFEDNDCLECLNLDWWNTPYKLSELKGENNGRE